MNRIELIQKIIDKDMFTTYLEIGSQSGKSFLPVRCRNKIAVDPVFDIPVEKKIKWLFKNPSNLRNRYFEETSDEFFLKRKSMLLKTNGLDVVLIDGLHTFRASLTDVFNCLTYLNKNGVIILHDCYPPHNAASTPANSKTDAAKMGIEGWTGEWCGDVWKTMVYLKQHHSEHFESYVIDSDFGLGVVRIRKRPEEMFDINSDLFNKIEKLNYDQMIQNADNLLDLRDKSSAWELINRKPYELDAGN